MEAVEWHIISAEAFPQFCKVHKRKVKPEHEPVMCDAIRELFEHLRDICNDPNSTTEEKEQILNRGGKMVTDLCNNGNGQMLLAAEAHKLLLEVMSQNRDYDLTNAECLSMIAEISTVSCHSRLWVMNNVLNVPDPYSLMMTEKAADCYVAICEDLVLLNVLQQCDLNLMQLEYDLSQVRTASFAAESYLDLEQRIDEVIRALKKDKVTSLSLKEVYSLLVVKSSQDSSATIVNNKSFRRLYYFTHQQMELYSKEILKVETEKGDEYMFGCLIYKLLASREGNRPSLIAQKIPHQLIDFISNQKDEQIVQHSIIAINDMLQVAEKDETFIQSFLLEHVPELLVKKIVAGREFTKKETDWEVIEDMQIPRIDVVRRLALNREVFKNTTLFEELMKEWDRFDKHFYDKVPRVSDLESLKLLKSEQKRTVLKEKVKVRRKSVFNRKAGEEQVNEINLAVSPLERRKSVVANMAVEQAARPDAIISQRTANKLVRRASMIQPGGNKPAEKGLAGIKRRLSVVGRGNETLRPPAPLQRRNSVSVNQRKASVVNYDEIKDFERTAIELGFIDNMSEEGSVKFGTGFSMQSMKSVDTVTSAKLFVSMLIELISAALRYTAHLEHINVYLKHNLPFRLLGLVADLETPPPALPHVLFLLGFMSVNEQAKQYLGKIGSVDHIITLTRRAYKLHGLCIPEIVSNCCLALAGIVMNHHTNIQFFSDAKGTEMIHQVLTVRGATNDARSVNSSAALICNLCFKHEEMKSKLGRDGCCKALVEALFNYNPREAGSNCSINSLFKAIGNMALNVDNMKLFLESDVQGAFAKYISECSSDSDVCTLESCMLTLSNLVMEKDMMEAFSDCVAPILSLLRRSLFNQTEVFRWCFEAIGHLCRWPPSARVFTLNDGIQTVLFLLPYLEGNTGLQSAVIYLIGVQMTDPTNALHVLDDRVIDYFKTILKSFIKYKQDAGQHADGEDVILNTTLPLNCLRCIGRIFVQKYAFNRGIETELFPLLIQLVPLCIDQGMLAYEVLRVIMAFLHDASKDLPSIEPDIEEFNDIVDATLELDWQSWIEAPSQSVDGRLSALDAPWNRFLDGPNDPELTIKPYDKQRPGKRAWKVLGLTVDQMSDLVENIRLMLSNPRSKRNLRLQRVGIGILAYIAQERIATPSFFKRLCPPENKKDPIFLRPNDANQGTPALLRRKSIVEKVFKRPETEEPTYLLGDCRPEDTASVVSIVCQALESFSHEKMVAYNSYSLIITLAWQSLSDENRIILLCDRHLLEVMKKHTLTSERQDYIEFHLAVRYYSRLLKTGGHTEDEAMKNSRLNAPVQKPKKSARGKGKGLERQVTVIHGQEYRVFTNEEVHELFDLAYAPYDMHQSGYWDNPYPDGVQSLSSEMRSKLRKGGKVQIVINGERKVMQWKSTHDLLVLQWRVAEKNDTKKILTYPFKIAVSRIYNISRGAATKSLKTEVEQDSFLTENLCYAIIGPPLNTHKEGLELSIICRTFKKREESLLLFSKWREAAAYGFR